MTVHFSNSNFELGNSLFVYIETFLLLYFCELCMTICRTCKVKTQYDHLDSGFITYCTVKLLKVKLQY